MKPFALMLALGVLTAAASPAAAKIVCNGEWQVVGGNEIQTPYCADRHLAKVARKYGDRVTARKVRNNPIAKDKVCGFVGADPSVAGICNPDYQD
jgi:hypothetical protein